MLLETFKHVSCCSIVVLGKWLGTCKHMSYRAPWYEIALKGWGGRICKEEPISFSFKAPILFYSCLWIYHLFFRLCCDLFIILSSTTSFSYLHSLHLIVCLHYSYVPSQWFSAMYCYEHPVFLFFGFSVVGWVWLRALGGSGGMADPS
jgi:hypothetical protein